MNRSVQDIYPLSPTQQGMLFHNLYGPKTGVYVVQVGYTLKGELNHDAFDQAWQQLIERHTILRTAFVWDNLESPV
ncbi:MAG: condensation domain-containing protein, partial [Cyanobacteria bacterium P01_H01_bin.26]